MRCLSLCGLEANTHYLICCMLDGARPKRIRRGSGRTRLITSFNALFLLNDLSIGCLRVLKREQINLTLTKCSLPRHCIETAVSLQAGSFARWTRCSNTRVCLERAEASSPTLLVYLWRYLLAERRMLLRSIRLRQQLCTIELISVWLPGRLCLMQVSDVVAVCLEAFHVRSIARRGR